jgi:hypothetical protein
MSLSEPISPDENPLIARESYLEKLMEGYPPGGDWYKRLVEGNWVGYDDDPRERRERS